MAKGSRAGHTETTSLRKSRQRASVGLTKDTPDLLMPTSHTQCAVPPPMEEEGHWLSVLLCPLSLPQPAGRCQGAAPETGSACRQRECSHHL